MESYGLCKKYNETEEQVKALPQKGYSVLDE
jgi:hypothetical protein